MAAQEEDRILEFCDRRLGYPILVREDVRPNVVEYIRAVTTRWVLLCDAQPNVLLLARSIARRAPGCVAVLPFTLGEGRKRLATLEMVLDALRHVEVERSTLIVGVGGGVASDLFGFAAAVYMRGVPYAHVATTLVAMVDAAIGGKSGVDLRAGKNLAGVFRNPQAVFVHIDALQTLPYREVRAGLAEVLKAAIIEGGALFESLETLAPYPLWRWPWHDLIAEAIQVKTMIVADDVLEAGMRQLLNLGHTFAHGLESASNYSLAHGAGVALGLRAAGLLALNTGSFSQPEHLRVLALLALMGLPLRTSLAPEVVYRAMQGDKKSRNGRLQFVLPRAIGDVEYGIEVPDRLVRGVLAQLTRTPQGLG